MKKFFIFLLSIAVIAAIIYFLFFYNAGGMPHSNATFVDSRQTAHVVALDIFT